MQNTKSNNSRAPKVFISYARNDEDYSNELVKQLAPCKQSFIGDLWHDKNLKLGQSWEDEIYHHLIKSDIVLFLVSPDFLASTECAKEVDTAFKMNEKNALRIAPIIIRDCVWDKAWGGRLKKLHVFPSNGKPISEYAGGPDRFYRDAVISLTKIIPTSSIQTPDPEQESEPKRESERPWQLSNIINSTFDFFTNHKKLSLFLAVAVPTVFLSAILNNPQEKFVPASTRTSCSNSDFTKESLIDYLESGDYDECLHHNINSDIDADIKEMTIAAESLYELNHNNVKAIEARVEGAKPKDAQFMPLYRQVRGTLYLYKGLHQNPDDLKEAFTEFKATHEGYKNLIYSKRMALALQAGSCSPPAALSEDNEKILIGEVGSLIRKQINKSISTENNAAYFASLNEQLPWHKERPKEGKEHINDKLTQCVDI